MTDGFVHQLPSSWAIEQLGTIAEINPKLNKSVIDDRLSVSFVPMPAVEAGTGRMRVAQERPFGEVKKGYTPFREGDVLFAKITPCMENGKMAVAPLLRNGYGFGSTEFHILRPCTGISAEFIYYFVSSQRFRTDAEHNMTGAVGQRRVPVTYLSEHPIPVPPSGEQHRIVAKIDELFSELDEGVESLKTAREQLSVYRQAVLKGAFEGKLTAQWRGEHRGKLDTAEQLLNRMRRERELHHERQVAKWNCAVNTWQENGSNGKKPSKPRAPKSVTSLSGEVIAGLQHLPTGWIWAKLGWMTCGVEYGTAAKSSVAGLVPVLRMGNLQRGKIDWTDLAYSSDKAEMDQYSLQPGDVLFNRTNSPELVGKTAIYRGEQPALFAGYLIRVNHIESTADSQYLNLFLNSHVARQHGNSVKTDAVNQSNINGEKLQNYPFPYCTLLEQREIVRILDEKLSLVEQMQEDIETALLQADALRESILTTAFSGRLVGQDPTDEPASTLLERIKPEKSRQVVNNKNGKRKAAA